MKKTNKNTTKLKEITKNIKKQKKKNSYEIISWLVSKNKK